MSYSYIAVYCELFLVIFQALSFEHIKLKFSIQIAIYISLNVIAFCILIFSVSGIEKLVMKMLFAKRENYILSVPTNSSSQFSV